MKQKTSKTAVKRIKKVSGTGKLMRRKILAQHLVHRKSSRSIKQSGSPTQISKAETSRVKRLTPNGVN